MNMITARMKHWRSNFSWKQAGIIAVMFCLFTAAICLSPEPVQAQTTPPVCSDAANFLPPPPTPGDGILSRISRSIGTMLGDITRDLFININEGIGPTLQALLTLYIAINGILFTFGMVQFTLYDFMMRMIKISIIVILLSPDAWNFFNNYVVYFFNASTDALITQLTQIMVGTVVSPYNPAAPLGPANQPFAVLDDVLVKILSARMTVSWLASFFTGPYGVMYSLLIGFAVILFLWGVLIVALVYLMSLVLRTLLFGLAPIFISCMLFNRTRHLFDGWINQVVNACLQPIILFAVFAFFAKLVEGTLDDILAVPVCWTELNESMRGTSTHLHYWRFMLDGNPYPKWWGFTGADSPTSPIFPIDFSTAIILLLLAELAGRFNRIAVTLASELAAAGTDLMSFEGSLKGFISPFGNKKASTAAGNVGNRVNPGGRTVSRPGGGFTAASTEQANKIKSVLDTVRERAGAKTGIRSRGTGADET